MPALCSTLHPARVVETILALFARKRPNSSRLVVQGMTVTVVVGMRVLAVTVGLVRVAKAYGGGGKAEGGWRHRRNKKRHVWYPQEI